MDHEGFDAIVRETISLLPEPFREELKDVVITIEENPPAKGHSTEILLGLYEGVPITAWGREHTGKLPDKITLYRASMERLARSDTELRRIIRTTLLHEIAHHYGFGHEQIRSMEERWGKGV